MNRLTPEEEKSILRKILDVTNIPLKRAIASGSYGTIHPLENDQRKVAKIIIMDTIHDAYELKAAQQSFLKELRLTKSMGNVGIGPRVDPNTTVTYRITLDTPLMKKLGVCDTYASNIMYFSMIVMERLDTSLYHYCTDYPCASTGTMRQYIPSLIKLLRQMANMGKICADLKPENIMVNYDRHTHEVTKVRFIDFGLDWCDTRQYAGNETFGRYKEILGAPQYRTFLFLLMLTTLGFNTSVILFPHRLGEQLIEYAMDVMRRRGNRRVHLYVVDFWKSPQETEQDFRKIVDHYDTDRNDIVERYTRMFAPVDDGESSDDCEPL